MSNSAKKFPLNRSKTAQSTSAASERKPALSIIEDIQRARVVVATQESLAEHGVVFPALLAKVIELVGYVAGTIAGVSTLTVDVEEVRKQKQLERI